MAERETDVARCRVCNDRIEHHDPTGDGLASWWSHEQHPEDGHDAVVVRDEEWWVPDSRRRQVTAPSEQEWEGATLDVEALRPKPCGCCDGGLLMACTCRDYRNDLDRALDEVERLRTQIERERQLARQEALTEAKEAVKRDWRRPDLIEARLIKLLVDAGGVS